MTTPGTALVTGATGFVGGHLVARLVDEGIPVRALIRHADAALAAGDVEYVIGDLRDETAVRRATRGVSVLYHAAAVVTGGPGDLWGTNVEGTRTLLRVAVANGVRRVVHLSSVAVYQSPLAPSIDEEAAIGGLDLYGQSKTHVEAIVRETCAEQVEYVILRPCQIYGPGDRSGYTARLVGLLARPRIPVAWGSARFSLVHVDDVIDAIGAAGSERAAAGGVFNIAGPRQTSLRDLAETVPGSDPKRIVAIPRTALRGALAARWLLHAARNPNVRPVLRSYASDSLHGSMWLGGPDYLTTRARATLGFDPRVDPVAGLWGLIHETPAIE